MRILLFSGNGCVVEMAGGAEKVLCNMANELTLRGHDVTVMCNDIKHGVPFYPLNPQVHFVNLDGAGNKKSIPRMKKIVRELTRPFRKTVLAPFFLDPVASHKLRELVPAIKQAIHAAQPDVIISYSIEDHHAVLNAIGHHCSLICMLHNTPDVLLPQSKSILSSLRHCDCLQVLLPSFAARVHTALPFVKNIQVIPNVVPPPVENKKHGTDRKEYSITMIGRLNREHKQQHFLIRSFASLAKDYPQWKVHFYGGDAEPLYEAYLLTLIQEFNLENQVFLLGKTKTPIEVLYKSDIFAFPTAFEGFPLALTEAMAVGLPCIGLKTTPAVNELIIDGYNGLLSENNEADFAQKLKRMMDDPLLRATLGQSGQEFVKQFEPKTIWDQWEKLIVETVQQFQRRNSCVQKAA